MVVVLMTDLRSPNQTTQMVAAQPDVAAANFSELPRRAAGAVADAFAPAIAYREAGDYARAESWLTEHLLAQPDDAQALAHLAHIQMLRKRDTAAHATLVHAEAIAPDDPLILRNRARLALRAQKIEVAASAAARALAADPAGLENRLVQAIVLGIQGETERALKVMDALLTERPDFAEALANRAVLHLRGRNAAAAMADAYRALEIKPHLSQPWRLLASMHAQAMRTGDALSALRRYCELEPEDAAALADFGELLRQRGLTEEALKILSRAIEIAPNLVSAWVNYGTALQQAKRADDAAMAYERALALKPDLAEVHSNLGIALKEQGKLDEAVARYEQALACKPDFAEAHSNLGTVLKDQGKLDEAVACYRRALGLKPDFAEAHSNLGSALKDQGKVDEAVACCRRALVLKPDLAEAHSNLGNALKDQGKLDEAVACYRRALVLKPDFAEAHSNLGIVLKDQRKVDEAVACCRRALVLKPDFAEAHSNLGSALKDQGKLGEAVAAFRQAIGIKPDYADAHYNLGHALRDQGKLDEAVASYDRALALKADHEAFSGAAYGAIKLCDWDRWTRFAVDINAHVSGKKSIVSPFVLLGYSGDPALQLQCARNLIENIIPSPPPPFWSGQTWRNDKLRVAYLSADFRSHPGASLMAGLFEQHDRSRFEVIGVSFGVDDGSEMRKRLVAAFDEFHDVRRKSDQEVAKFLYDTHVDIAIDRNGYTHDSRSSIFAHRPVPIQVNYLGFPATMGADFIDYIIADAMVLPVEQQPYYTEKVVYLPAD